MTVPSPDHSRPTDAATGGSSYRHADTLRPSPGFTLEAAADASGVWIRFTAPSIRGVWIESRGRSGEWEFLAINLERDCFDRRPLKNPAQIEVREYRARYFDRGSINGPWSPAQKIALTPSSRAFTDELNFPPSAPE